jgi:hypothetical protein
MAHGKSKHDKPAPNSVKQGPYKNKMSGDGKPKSKGMNVRTGKFSSKTN